MGVLVSMGGLIFGFDTGQISGFLEMKDFLQRFGTLGPNPKDPGGQEIYQFSNVRSGLIVGMVSALRDTCVVQEGGCDTDGCVRGSCPLGLWLER